MLLELLAKPIDLRSVGSDRITMQIDLVVSESRQIGMGDVGPQGCGPTCHHRLLFLPRPCVRMRCNACLRTKITTIDNR